MARPRISLNAQQERALDELRAAQLAATRAAEHRDELARQSVALMVPWRCLGESLGVSAQAAHQRFANPDK